MPISRPGMSRRRLIAGLVAAGILPGAALAQEGGRAQRKAPTSSGDQPELQVVGRPATGTTRPLIGGSDDRSSIRRRAPRRGGDRPAAGGVVRGGTPATAR